MKPVVIDASVAARWVFPESGFEEARALLVQADHGELLLLAPDLLICEMANITWKKCRLRGEITEEVAISSMCGVMAINMTFRPVHTLWERALMIALAQRVTAYDATYLALALQERCDLVTCDERLVRILNPLYGCVRLL